MADQFHLPLTPPSSRPASFKEHEAGRAVPAASKAPTSKHHPGSDKRRSSGSQSAIAAKASNLIGPHQTTQIQSGNSQPSLQCRDEAYNSLKSRPPFSVYQRPPTTTISGSEIARQRREIGKLQVARQRGQATTFYRIFSADQIKATDPQKTRALWQDVMSPRYMQPTKASQKGKELLSPSQSSGTGRSTEVSSARLANATVRDKDFEETQLEIRGIRKLGPCSLALSGPYDHFGTEPSPDRNNSNNFYQSKVTADRGFLKPLESLWAAFLRVDDEFIKEVHCAYEVLDERSLPESEYKAFALKSLLLGDYSMRLNDPVRAVAVQRMIEPNLEANKHDWIEPPFIPGDRSKPAKPFHFKMFPDCQYYLSNKIFNPEYRDLTQNVVKTRSRIATCPYFTIEFKATEEQSFVAQNQIAAAGAIALYNRFLLKREAYGESAAEQITHTRHYCLTMEKRDYAFWIIRPNLGDDGHWEGCTLQVLDKGDCFTEQGVVKLIHWINEIHLWAHQEYARDCENDIKRIMRWQRVRTSNVYEDNEKGKTNS